jgi:hypothetical protein
MDPLLRHLCLIHEGPAPLECGPIASFLAAGLKAGGRGIFLGSPKMMSTLQERLRQERIDVPLEARRGSLILIANQNHLKEGRFDPVAHLAMVEQLYHQALDEGYTGLWGAGDITWEFGPKNNLSLLMRYESALDRMFERLPQLHALCHYHKDTLPLRSVGDALLTHRGVFLKDTPPRWNPFFSPAEFFPHPTLPTDLQIEHMLGLLAQRS